MGKTWEEGGNNKSFPKLKKATGKLDQQGQESPPEQREHIYKEDRKESNCQNYTNIYQLINM